MARTNPCQRFTAALWWGASSCGDAVSKGVTAAGRFLSNHFGRWSVEKSVISGVTKLGLIAYSAWFYVESEQRMHLT